MANMFLSLKNIQGESLDYIHEGEIEIHEWTWGVDNNASYSLTPSEAAPHSEFDHVVITKVFDKSSVTLMNYCASGQKINEGVITCRKQDGDTKVAFLKIKLTGVKVNSVKWTAKNEEHLPGIPETVDLSYFSFQVIYETQGNDGLLTGPTEFDFILTKQKASK
jgi:type VI secretion system secreted protein Hcp